MAKITITTGESIEAPADKRLVLAIEESGVNIGHRCGGYAGCTTCRVNFVEGEPDTFTEAEYNKLKTAGLLGQVRLSCQILCDHDMTVTPLMTKESVGWDDTGPKPETTVTPEAKFIPKSEFPQ
jgi:ferredoxin